MKIDILHITNAEMEIMKILWRMGRPVTAMEISAAMSDGRRNSSTIHTLAMRLVNKAVVKYYKAGGMNYYFSYINEEDYRFVVTKVFVNEMHSGDIVDMMQLLLSDLELDGEVLDRLRELVDTAVPPSKVIAGAGRSKSEHQDLELLAHATGENATHDERSEVNEEAKLVEDAKEHNPHTMTRRINAAVVRLLPNEGVSRRVPISPFNIRRGSIYLGSSVLRLTG